MWHEVKLAVVVDVKHVVKMTKTGAETHTDKHK